MMIGLVRYLLLSGFVAATPAAASQNEPASDDQSTIVVKGNRSADQDMKDFVRALTPTPPGGQLSRFEQHVCPRAVGLPQIQQQSLAKRIRRVAREVGIAVGGANCVPNLFVMVTQDKKVLLTELQRRYSHYFGELSSQEIRRLARHPGPAVAWHLQGVPISAQGTEASYDPVLRAYLNRTTGASSRITATGRRQFEGAVVVVERRSLAGVTVTQLADYAAIRALVGSDPSRLSASSPPTILRVLDSPAGSAVPLSLTEWDLGFLRGFYSAPRNLSASAQRSAISRSVTKEAERRPAE